MEDEIKAHRRKFSLALEPIKAMLTHKQTTLDKERWMVLVERTRNSIINQPEQYLGRELAKKKVLVITIVNLLFDEFIHEREVRWQVLAAYAVKKARKVKR